MNPRRRRHNRIARKRRRAGLRFGDGILAIHLEEGARLYAKLTAQFQAWADKQAVAILGHALNWPVEIVELEPFK